MIVLVACVSSTLVLFERTHVLPMNIFPRQAPVAVACEGVSKFHSVGAARDSVSEPKVARIRSGCWVGGRESQVQSLVLLLLRLAAGRRVVTVPPAPSGHITRSPAPA